MSLRRIPVLSEFEIIRNFPQQLVNASDHLIRWPRLTTEFDPQTEFQVETNCRFGNVGHLISKILNLVRSEVGLSHKHSRFGNEPFCDLQQWFFARDTQFDILGPSEITRPASRVRRSL